MSDMIVRAIYSVSLPPISKTSSAPVALRLTSSSAFEFALLATRIVQ